MDLTRRGISSVLLLLAQIKTDGRPVTARPPGPTLCAAASLPASSTITLNIGRADIPGLHIPPDVVALTVNGFVALGDKGVGALYVRGSASGLMAIQDALGAWWNLSVANGWCFAGWFGAKGDGAADDSEAIQAAANALSAAGGGDLHLSDSLAPYVIGTGLVLMHGVRLMGSGVSTWYGAASDPETWTNRGVWLKPQDMTNPCITLGAPGGGVHGVNAIYVHAKPGLGWKPTVYPWFIRVIYSFSKLSSILIVGGYNGIVWDYPAENGGGTYCSMQDIFLSCFNIGRKFSNVNDTLSERNIRHRNMWYPLDTGVKA